MRKCSSEIQNALKTAVKQTVADLGGLDAAASCTRVGRSQIFDYGSIGTDKFIPIDVALDLELISGNPRITRALAEAQGYELQPIEGSPTHQLIDCLSRISEENGRLFRDVTLHLKGDGHLARSKVAEVMRDMSELIQAAKEAHRALLAETAPHKKNED